MDGNKQSMVVGVHYYNVLMMILSIKMEMLDYRMVRYSIFMMVCGNNYFNTKYFNK